MNRPRGTVPPPPPPKKAFAAPLVAMAVGLVVFLGVIAFVATRGGDDDGTAAATPTSTGDQVQTAPVAWTGDRLPELVDAGADVAVGKVAPTLSGVSFDGTPVTIGEDGKAKLVVFLAHWCPHCQAEVPVLVKWMEDGGVPDEAEVYAVATATTPTRDNYPPSAWLAREGWPTPVLVDSDDGQAAGAYGLSAFPFMVALHGDGTVAARASGELSTDHLDQMVAAALAG